MVPDTSSSLDDPRERAQHINADHLAMTKFSGRDDPGYRKVGGELCLLVKGIGKRLKEGLQKERERPDDENGE